MTIAIAVLDDIPQLCNLLGILFSQEAEFDPDPEKQAAGLHRIIVDRNVGVVFAAKEGERIVGMVLLLWTVSTFLGGKVALLEDVVIHPEERGRGLGSQLLRAAIEEASASGCLRITLLTDSSNREAQEFYERAGFAPSSMIPMRLLLPRAR